MASGNGFTPTQRRLLDKLEDGEGHSKESLVALLGDSEAAPNTLRVHMTYLRQRLRASSRSVIFESINGVGYYRLVRLVGKGE